MKNSVRGFIFLAVLASLFMTACAVDLDGGTVIITNNSNKDFYGRVWTDTKELYNGRISAWNSKTFSVYEDSNVYTDFESSNGGKSNPSGYVSKKRSLILEL